MKKIFVIFGTRPEAIKMVPVYKRLKEAGCFDVRVVVSGQHREMLDQVLERYHIKPDVDFNIMKENQQLTELSTRLMTAFGELFTADKPDLVLVHGDTTTALVAAFSAFYHKVKIGHVEAGLRTYNKYNPFPEEANRQLISKFADYHFCPTDAAAQNLFIENIKKKVYITGNTSIDTLLENVADTTYQNDFLETIEEGKLILLTAHRRENLGAGMENIFTAIRTIAQKYPDYTIVFPVHLNPQIQTIAANYLTDVQNVHLIAPLDVFDFHHYMKKAKLILTDSGGIQEEAPSLGMPVLVLRETTERPEGVEVGTLKLVGTDVAKIVAETTKIIEDPEYAASFKNIQNPYGDGTAAAQIRDILIADQEDI